MKMLDIHLRGRSHSAAIVDVGPGGASVAICVVSPSGAARILSTGSSKLSLEAHTLEQDASQIGSQIGEAAQAAFRTPLGRPVEHVYVVVHAPWALSRSLHGKAVYERPTKIHDATIAQVAREALAGASASSANLIESSVVRVELNGYPTAAPSGKSAHMLSVDLLLSECEQSLKSAVSEAVGKAFPVAKVSWRSAARALTNFARTSDALDHHFCVIDMGVATSHVMSVRGGSVAEKTVAEGTRTIVARLAGTKPADEQLSSIRMLERDAASSETAEALQRALAIAEQSLVPPFAEAIGVMAADRRVANNVLLLAHPDLEPWLSRFFSRIDFAQFTVTTLPFTVFTPAGMAQGGSLPAENELLVDAALFNTETAATA